MYTYTHVHLRSFLCVYIHPHPHMFTPLSLMTVSDLRGIRNHQPNTLSPFYKRENQCSDRKCGCVSIVTPIGEGMKSDLFSSAHFLLGRCSVKFHRREAWRWIRCVPHLPPLWRMDPPLFWISVSSSLKWSFLDQTALTWGPAGTFGVQVSSPTYTKVPSFLDLCALFYDKT